MVRDSVVRVVSCPKRQNWMNAESSARMFIRVLRESVSPGFWGRRCLNSGFDGDDQGGDGNHDFDDQFYDLLGLQPFLCACLPSSMSSDFARLRYFLHLPVWTGVFLLLLFTGEPQPAEAGA